MLAVRGLSKSWGAHTALHPTDLTLAEGQAVALLGANGSGKSTLLSLISGLRIPTAGEATWKGANTRSPSARASMGVLPERPALPPHHCLRALFEAVGASGPTDELALAPLLDVPIKTLSAGQRQRASLALALAGTPGLLLLDEPLNALDTASMDALVALVRQRVDGGCALLLATHHPERWPFVTERITLHEGRIQ